MVRLFPLTGWDQLLMQFLIYISWWLRLLNCLSSIHWLFVFLLWTMTCQICLPVCWFDDDGDLGIWFLELFTDSSYCSGGQRFPPVLQALWIVPCFNSRVRIQQALTLKEQRENHYLCEPCSRAAVESQALSFATTVRNQLPMSVKQKTVHSYVLIKLLQKQAGAQSWLPRWSLPIPCQNTQQSNKSNLVM